MKKMKTRANGVAATLEHNGNGANRMAERDEFLAQLNASLEAVSDPMTGLGNRRRWERANR